MQKRFDYIAYRRNKISGRYKLNRRTGEMLSSIEAFKGNKGLFILDVGTADGFMVNKYREHFNDCRAFGIEPSMDFIKSGRNDNAALIQAEGENIPFRDNVFDVITASSALDHMRDPARFLRDARRVLKNDGVIIISLAEAFYDRLAVWLRIKEDDHAFRFTKKSLGKILDESGFKVEKISNFTFFYMAAIARPSK